MMPPYGGVGVNPHWKSRRKERSDGCRVHVNHMNFPGVTQEQYDAVLEQLNLSGRMPPGGCPTPPEEGWRRGGRVGVAGNVRHFLYEEALTKPCRMRGYRAPKSRLGRCMPRWSPQCRKPREEGRGLAALPSSYCLFTRLPRRRKPAERVAAGPIGRPQPG